MTKQVGAPRIRVRAGRATREGGRRPVCAPVRTAPLPLAHRAAAALALALLFLLLAGAGSPAAADTPAQQAVRVGYPIQENLTECSETGQYSGYTYDYLQEIAQYTGWHYEFVRYEGTAEEQAAAAREDLASGNIDLLGDMEYSEPLAERYAYPLHSYGYSYTVLFASDENDSVRASNIYRSSSLRIAVWEGFESEIENLASYAGHAGITYELATYGSKQEALDALAGGSADVVLGDILSVPDDCSTVLRFSPTPLYFAVSPQASDKAAQIDQALEAIEESEPSFRDALFSTYFPATHPVAELTESELAYCAGAGTLRVGVYPDRAPMSYLDEDGKVTGATVDMLERIAEATGLSFEYVVLDNAADLHDQVEENRLDIVAGLDRSLVYAQEADLSMSVAYATCPVIVAYNDATPYERLRDDMTMAVTEERELTFRNQGYDVIAYPTLRDCLAAVDRGEADYTFDCSYLLSYYLAAGTYDNLKTANATVQTVDPCFGFVHPASTELLSSFNKVIQNTTAREVSAMVYSHFPEQEASLDSFIRQYPLVLAAIIAVPLAFVAAALGFIAFTRSRAAHRDALTQVYNSTAFKRRAERALSSNSKEQRYLLILDIDNFKGINDRFGHLYGDRALKTVAQELTKASGGTGIAGRLGGDEFLALWPAESEEQVQTRADALIAGIGALQPGQKEPLSVSMGIAKAKRGCEYDDLYRRADDALYQAKRTGKGKAVVQG